MPSKYITHIYLLVYLYYYYIYSTYISLLVCNYNVMTNYF